MVGPLQYLLFVNHLFINVTFVVITPNATTPLLDGLLHFNYPLSRGKPGNSIQLANVVEDLGVPMDNSFSPSIHCKEAAFKARRMLFVIRRSFAELWVSTFAPIYNTLAWPHLEYASAGDEAREGFPPTAI